MNYEIVLEYSERRNFSMFRQQYIIILIILMSLACLPVFAGDQNDLAVQRLFHIERNKNANIVVYEARVQADGTLDQEQAVIVYWLMFAKDSSRQGLNKFENNRAYGFETESLSKDSVIIKLKANPERRIKIRSINDKYRAIITVGDKRVYLEHIYVMADDKGLRTSVQYVEIFGNDSKTGNDFYEKIVPD